MAKLLQVATNLWRDTESKVYYAIARVGGQQKWKSLRTTDPAIAKSRLPVQLAKWARLKKGGGRLPFVEAYEAWLATEVASRNLRERSLEDLETVKKGMFKTWPALERMPLERIKREEVERWIAGRKASVNWQRANHDLRVIKAVLRWAVRQGHITDNPAADIPCAKPQKRVAMIPSRQEVADIVAWLRGKPVSKPGVKKTRHRAPEAADFVELLALTGLRRNEAAGLRWLDVDEQRGFVAVREQLGDEGKGVLLKSGHQRVVPLFPALRQLLRRLADEHGQDGRIMRVDQCRKAIASACDALGLPHYGHHAFRHFFASNAVEASVDWKTLAEWLGHSDGGFLASTTYSHLRTEHAALMADRMTRGVQG